MCAAFIGNNMTQTPSLQAGVGTYEVRQDRKVLQVHGPCSAQLSSFDMPPQDFRYSFGVMQCRRTFQCCIPSLAFSEKWMKVTGRTYEDRTSNQRPTPGLSLTHLHNAGNRHPASLPKLRDQQLQAIFSVAYHHEPA